MDAMSIKKMEEFGDFEPVHQDTTFDASLFRMIMTMGAIIMLFMVNIIILMMTIPGCWGLCSSLPGHNGPRHPVQDSAHQDWICDQAE